MDNNKLLKDMGFFEHDGWLCNPTQNGEKTFKLFDPVFGAEGKSLDWILKVISAEAYNSGYRYGIKTTRERLADELIEKALEMKKVI